METPCLDPEKGALSLAKIRAPPKNVRERHAERHCSKGVTSPSTITSVNEDKPRLDSVFLEWFIDENDLFADLGYHELHKDFEEEIERFKGMEVIDSETREQLRTALLSVLGNPKHQDEARAMKSGKAIRNWWVKIVKANLATLKKDGEPLPIQETSTHPIVDSFLQRIGVKGSAHPRGENTRNPGPLPSDTDQNSSDSGSDREYVVHSSVDEDFGPTRHPQPHESTENHAQAPLKFSPEARSYVKSLKQAKTPDDIKESDASFVTNNLMFGSSYL